VAAFCATEGGNAGAGEAAGATGVPFAASDPMEWIHCHIARILTRPDERVSGIPGPIAEVVCRPLAKNDEDRYQTAAGVEADLRRCLGRVLINRLVARFRAMSGVWKFCAWIAA